MEFQDVYGLSKTHYVINNYLLPFLKYLWDNCNMVLYYRDLISKIKEEKKNEKEKDPQMLRERTRDYLPRSSFALLFDSVHNIRIPTSRRTIRIKPLLKVISGYSFIPQYKIINVANIPRFTAVLRIVEYPPVRYCIFFVE